MRILTCYMCDAVATTREHVPPRCIFPAQQEYRINLRTVPSCDDHNSKKSKDDELLRHVVATVGGNNDLSLLVVDKAVSAMEQRPKITGTFLPNLKVIQVEDFETASYTINIPRFENSIKSLVRGLYYDQTGKKLLQELTVAWGALMNADYSISPYFEIIRHGETTLPKMTRGEHPRIFQYDFHENGKTGLFRLRFYEGHPIYVTWTEV